MSDTLSPENEDFIQTAIRRGDYHDRGEVLDEAMELLRKRDELRRDIQQGIDELDRGDRIEGEEVFRELEDKAHQAIDRLR